MPKELLIFCPSRIRYIPNSLKDYLVCSRLKCQRNVKVIHRHWKQIWSQNVLQRVVHGYFKARKIDVYEIFFFKLEMNAPRNYYKWRSLVLVFGKLLTANSKLN